MSNVFYVYTLSYPDEMGGTVFYVGRGCGKRIDEHAREAKRGIQSPKCAAIRQIWSMGYEVVASFVAENLSGREANLLERKLIKQYGRDSLTNQTDGGEGASSVMPDEDRRVVVSLSLSADTLRGFTEAYALAEGSKPSLEQVREKARDVIFQGIDTYIKQHIEIEGTIIL